MNDKNETTTLPTNDAARETSEELALEVRRSRKVRTGIKGGFRTQPDCGTWCA